MIDPNTVVRSGRINVAYHSEADYQYRFVITLEDGRRFLMTGHNFTTGADALRAGIKRRFKLIEKGYPA